MYPQGCGGSSPFFGTILLVFNHLSPWCPVWCPKKPGLVSAWCPIFIPGLRTPLVPALIVCANFIEDGESCHAALSLFRFRTRQPNQESQSGWGVEVLPRGR